MSDKTILEQWREIAYNQQADRTTTARGNTITAAYVKILLT